MGLKCLVVCVVVLSALITHRVEGFGLDNIIRALEARDLKTATRDIKEPADVIVTVALEAIDLNSDGKLALSEVRVILNLLFGSRFPEQIIGYMMTLAIITDADNSGFIEQNEYQKAASTFVVETNEREVGKAVAMSLGVQTAFEGFAESNIPLMIRVFDRDGDGQIDREERRKFDDLSGSPRVESIARRADRDDDGKLNEAESHQWLDEVLNNYPYTFRGWMRYCKIASLGGYELADECAGI